MATPAQWNLELGPHADWKGAYAFVERQVKSYIFIGNLSTAEFVDVMYPAHHAKGEGITARKRIFTALAALAKHQLKDYCEPGQPRPLKHNPKKIVTPLVWRAPAAKPTIQRYSISPSDDGIVYDYEDDKGDWVRWEDVKNG